jgi:hypothetical protein
MVGLPHLSFCPPVQALEAHPQTDSTDLFVFGYVSAYVSSLSPVAAVCSTTEVTRSSTRASLVGLPPCTWRGRGQDISHDCNRLPAHVLKARLPESRPPELTWLYSLTHRHILAVMLAYLRRRTSPMSPVPRCRPVARRIVPFPMSLFPCSS